MPVSGSVRRDFFIAPFQGAEGCLTQAFLPTSDPSGIG
jgi:hypothetical protein